ncbi:hypothetical protein J2R98_002211 [Alkalibacillus filiformis]|uniref:Uncharacterized protein n=1 Tax=Alkalibacillus filiformis TaxID=200990 RepID=A0ABU0DV76_9BACI|nr:hypothetical protein [Alkalibacillus filiformis]MDQ0352367.1 hypothetical protein [Alkalibacillus filiformis]
MNEVEGLIDQLQKDDFKTMILRRVLMMAFEKLMNDGDYNYFRETILWIVHSGLFREVVRDEVLIWLASEVGRCFRSSTKFNNHGT